MHKSKMPLPVKTIIKSRGLIDGLGGPKKLGMAIVLEAGRILSVDYQNDISVLEDESQVIEYPTATVLPGLIDCHTHTNMPGSGLSVDEIAEDNDSIHLLNAVRNARLALENGVTTMRDNGGWNNVPFALKNGITNGIIPGPRVLACGNPITITGGHCWMMGGEADGIDAVRHTVRRLIKNGADFIKVMTSGGGTRGTASSRASYTPKEIQAIVDESHIHGKLVGGHAIATQAISNCIDAGVDMIIHCSFMQADGSLKFDPELGEQIASSDIWVNPTLFVGKSRMLELENLALHKKLSHAEYLELESSKRDMDQRMETSRLMLEAGIKIIAGSDCGWSAYEFGKFGLELDSLVEAGMSIPEALIAGTRNAADSVGLLNEIGTIEPGKVADLLVVQGDPTERIDALTKIVQVFQDGHEIL